MPKFSGTTRRPLRADVTAPVRTRGPRLVTHEGGAASGRDSESDLFLLAATNMVGEDTFYERAGDRDAHFVALVHRVTADNPAFIAGADPAGKVGFAQYLRETMLMRSAAELKTAKNRVHWDVRGSSAALLDAGARMLRPATADPEPDRIWDVLADPEGNEFCVLPRMR